MIWLSRNRKIFSNIDQTPIQVVGKAKLLILEVLKESGKKLDPFIRDLEKRWIGHFKFDSLSLPFSRPRAPPDWKLTMTALEFQEWGGHKGKIGIFFDGASKGNLGAARACGVFLSPRGKIIFRYSWGLGVQSNNQAEALALLKRCQLAIL